MFNFFKKNRELNHFSFLKNDFHSHLIPGVDDGSPDLTTSLMLIKALKTMGFEKIITTPHIMIDFYPNKSDELKKGLEILRAKLAEEKIEMSVEVAAEYYLDEHFKQLLEDDNILTFGDNYVLVEMSFIAPSINMHELLFKMISKGYRPILAHPERYGYFFNQLNKVAEVKKMGCKLQVNLLSLAGYYGKPIRQLALQLFANNLVDFVATDLHHDRHLEALKNYPNDMLELLMKYPNLMNKDL